MSCRCAFALGLIVAATAVLGLTVPASAFNFTEESARWEVPRLGAPSQEIWKSQAVDELTAQAAPALAAFAARYGGTWRYQVNRPTGTYHHIYGSGIDLGVDLKSAEEVEALARSFIQANPAIFSVGSDDLTVASLHQRPGQVVDHLPADLPGPAGVGRPGPPGLHRARPAVRDGIRCISADQHSAAHPASPTRPPSRIAKTDYRLPRETDRVDLWPS